MHLTVGQYHFEGHTPVACEELWQDRRDLELVEQTGYCEAQLTRHVRTAMPK